MAAYACTVMQALGATYESKAVANYFLSLAKNDCIDVSPMKLLKILYYAHGWHLAISGRPLLDEKVEAWKFGPVVPSVYHEFKGFGLNPISRPARKLSIAKGELVTETPEICPSGVAESVLKKLVWGVYGKLSAATLSNLTHQPDSPWYEVWFNRGGSHIKGTDIPDDLIQDYFKGKMSDAPRPA